MTKQMFSEYTYHAAPGAQFSEKEAQTIGVALEKVGGFPNLTPTAVVAAAKKKRSPLHKHFEWDDSTAASNYRVYQARHLLSHLVIEVEKNDTTVATKAFHNVSVVLEDEQRERQYHHLSAVVGDENLSQRVIEGAKRELDAWRERYKEYEYIFGGVFRAVDGLREMDPQQMTVHVKGKSPLITANL